MEIIAEKNNIILKGQSEYRFTSTKGLEKKVRIPAAEILRVVE